MKQRRTDSMRLAAPANDDPPSFVRGGGGGAALLNQMVAASVLSTVIAHGAPERACRRVGVDAKTMTGAELRRALPSIQESFRTSLPEEEAEQRIRSIGLLARLANRAS